jgi:hypothetical protein
MRLIFGMILGAALTVGGAYIADTGKSGPEARPMVNWDRLMPVIWALFGIMR